MAALSKSGSLVLSGLPLRHTTIAAARPYLSHAFTTSSARRDDKSSPRISPLVGNYIPREPIKPTNTQPPAPPRPPPPPPPQGPRSFTHNPSATSGANSDQSPPYSPRPSSAYAGNTASTTTGTSQPSGTYNASSPINLNSVLEQSKMRLNQVMDNTSPLKQALVYTRPVSGRTIFCEGGDGAPNMQHKAYSQQHAFQMLDRLVKDQKLKTLHFQQRFYERKGLERKRLKMQRWRVRFKKGFKAAASRVLELKKQGW